MKLVTLNYLAALSVSSYLSWPGSVMFSPGYPANTVKGRICLNERLDWDKDTSKETSDIYIKPRLIVIATILTIGCVLFYAIQRVKTFVPKFCPSNRSHASIGGRYRRNLLTFDELSKFYTFLILFYLFDSIIILVFYATQDILTQDGVFLIYHIVCVAFDVLCVIVLPIYILHKSQEDFPVIWSNYTPKTIKFYTTKTAYVPRRENCQPYLANSNQAIQTQNTERSEGSHTTQLPGVQEITQRYLTLHQRKVHEQEVGAAAACLGGVRPKIVKSAPSDTQGIAAGCSTAYIGSRRLTKVTRSLVAPKFVQKIKEEIPTRNIPHIPRRPSLQNRWKNNFSQMETKEENKVSRKKHVRSIFHFENESLDSPTIDS